MKASTVAGAYLAGLTVCVVVLAVGLFELHRRQTSDMAAAARVIAHQGTIIVDQGAIIADQGAIIAEHTARSSSFEASLVTLSELLQADNVRIRELEDDLRIRRFASAPVFGFADTRYKRIVSCSVEQPRARVAVILILGQSNAGNHGSGPLYVAHARVDNFNLNDGLCYAAADPLLGTSGEGANFATQLGDLLIDAKVYDRVILVPIALGGTFMQEWIVDSAVSRRLPIALLRLFLAGLTPDYLLWVHGEAHALSEKGEIDKYASDGRSIVRRFRAAGVSAPFIAALSTICGGSPHEGTRLALRQAVSAELGLLLGPDTDTLGPEFRRDGCHFNAKGVAAAARLWADTLAPIPLHP